MVYADIRSRQVSPDQVPERMMALALAQPRLPAQSRAKVVPNLRHIYNICRHSAWQGQRVPSLERVPVARVASSAAAHPG